VLCFFLNQINKQNLCQKQAAFVAEAIGNTDVEKQIELIVPDKELTIF
jgi:hypothetical protein